MLSPGFPHCIELQNWCPRPWKSIEFDQTVHKVLKKYGNPKIQPFVYSNFALYCGWQFSKSCLHCVPWITSTGIKSFSFSIVQVWKMGEPCVTSVLLAQVALGLEVIPAVEVFLVPLQPRAAEVCLGHHQHSSSSHLDLLQHLGLVQHLDKTVLVASLAQHQPHQLLPLLVLEGCLEEVVEEVRLSCWPTDLSNFVQLLCSAFAWFKLSVSASCRRVYSVSESEAIFSVNLII